LTPLRYRCLLESLNCSDFVSLDGLNGSQGGALRGAGRQHIGALVNLLCYYFLALPLGIWLAFNGLRLHGLWIGQCVALYLVGIGEWGIVAWSDWEKEVRKALARLDQGDEPSQAEEA
jgi:multidrug resistance protein, MATE family